MSMMICRRCDRHVDTDYDLDGVWGHTTYQCTACTEEIEAQREEERMLAEEVRDKS